MLNSRQRAQLRGMANSCETLFQVGKGGLSEAFYTQVSEALYVREMVKIRLLNTAPVSVREAADTVAAATGAEVVQVIGSKFVLYKRSDHPEIEHIALVK